MSIRLLWQSFSSLDTTSSTSQSLSFMENQGKVIEPIGPNSTGRVQLQGVSWLARCVDTLLHPLPVNTPVQIVDRVGLTLLIRPLAIPMGNVSKFSSIHPIVPLVPYEEAA